MAERFSGEPIDEWCKLLITGTRCSIVPSRARAGRMVSVSNGAPGHARPRILDLDIDFRAVTADLRLNDPQTLAQVFGQPGHDRGQETRGPPV
jgi:hypothetical protein